MTEYAVAMTTCESREIAHILARDVVEAQLAACVQLIDIESVYRWDGEVTESPETLLFMKTRMDAFEALRTHIEATHSYDVPEVVMLRIEGGSPAYLSWIDSSLA